jgi:hypothetical protein
MTNKASPSCQSKMSISGETTMIGMPNMCASLQPYLPKRRSPAGSVQNLASKTSKRHASRELPLDLIESNCFQGTVFSKSTRRATRTNMSNISVQSNTGTPGTNPNYLSFSLAWIYTEPESANSAPR